MACTLALDQSTAPFPWTSTFGPIDFHFCFKILVRENRAVDSSYLRLKWDIVCKNLRVGKLFLATVARASASPLS